MYSSFNPILRCDSITITDFGLQALIPEITVKNDRLCVTQCAFFLEETCHFV